MLTRNDGGTAREDGRVLGRVLLSSKTSDEETKITKGGFSRIVFNWLRVGAYLGLQLKALLLELLENCEILGIDTLETFDCLLDTEIPSMYPDERPMRP